MTIESFLNELCNQLVANTQAVNALAVAIQAQNGTAQIQTPAGNALTPTVLPGAAGAPAVTDVECDINAMPWDARIHSSAFNIPEDPASGHKKTGKNVWQKKRGVTKELITQIEAELMATAGGQDAIPSQPGDIPPGSLGVPGVGGVVPPGMTAQIPVVLPMPADINQATHQDCANIVQVFAQIHGVDVTTAHLAQWGMNDITQLPANYVIQFADYMGKEHDKLVAVGA